MVLLLPLFSSSFGGLRAERLPIFLFNAYNGATREHCDLPIYSDWEKFNSAAYKKGGMSPLDPSEVLRQKASSLNAVLAVSILLFMLIGTLTIAFGVAPTAYPNDIHLPANLADKWRTVLYPSGKPLKLFRAGGDFSVFASSWRALLPIFMIVFSPVEW